MTVAESLLKASKQCRPDEKIAWAEMLNSATEKVIFMEKLVLVVAVLTGSGLHNRV